MMFKISLTTVLLTLLWLLKSCWAVPIMPIISGIGTVITIEEYIRKLVVNTENDTRLEIMYTLKELEDKLSYKIDKLTPLLNDLPVQITLTRKQEIIRANMQNIKRVCEEAIMINNTLSHNKTAISKATYIQFRDDNENFVEKSLQRIYMILLNAGNKPFLEDDYKSTLQKFQHFSETGMSQQQQLASMWDIIATATAQYQIIKEVIFKLLAYNGEEDDLSQGVFLRVLNANHLHALSIFKSLIRDASREIWTKDPSGGHSPSDTYYQLNGFSKYVVREDQFDFYGTNCSKEQNRRCFRLKQLTSCRVNDGLCQQTRMCPDELIDCQRLEMFPHTNRYKMCKSSNPTDMKRYTSGFIPGDEDNKFSCPSKNTVNLGNLMNNDVSMCYYCDCVCKEKQVYYISTQQVDALFLKNEVITGARFVMKRNTLYIQIETAELHNGIVEEATVHWMDVKENDKLREEISWENLRSMNLGDIHLPSYRVLTGLQFVRSGQRISLTAISKRYDGRLIDTTAQKHTLKHGKSNFNLRNVDIPTKLRGVNIPMSKDNGYFNFTLTNLQKDGGQSVVPFIDLQAVRVHPPNVLAGVGLFIRGQEGSGGFLSLKLFTYDVSINMPEDEDDENI